jgi:hypothetical protein
LLVAEPVAEPGSTSGSCSEPGLPYSIPPVPPKPLSIR